MVHVIMLLFCVEGFLSFSNFIEIHQSRKKMIAPPPNLSPKEENKNTILKLLHFPFSLEKE